MHCSGKQSHHRSPCPKDTIIRVSQVAIAWNGESNVNFSLPHCGSKTDNSDRFVFQFGRLGIRPWSHKQSEKTSSSPVISHSKHLFPCLPLARHHPTNTGDWQHPNLATFFLACPFDQEAKNWSHKGGFQGYLPTSLFSYLTSQRWRRRMWFFPHKFTRGLTKSFKGPTFKFKDARRRCSR